MASVHDVAVYILEQQSPMSTMKLQKLVYYSQAWHLVWDDTPLFKEPIEAWANGPVVPALFKIHKRQFEYSAPWPEGSSTNLSKSEKETIGAVVHFYGPLSGRQLSILTHEEAPWNEARGDLGSTDRGWTEITHASMCDFYAALDVSDDAQLIDEIDWDRIGEAD